MNTKKERKEFLLSRFKGDLAFIENTENYYAAFKYVIDKCATAQLENTLLYEQGHFSDGEYTYNVSRIQIARTRAIVAHGEWVVERLKQSKTPHTRQTLVSSIYSDIFGIELKEEAAHNTTGEPEVKWIDFEIEGISSYADFLKRYFDAYEISGASVEWEEGWQAAIAWCKGIIDKANRIGG